MKTEIQEIIEMTSYALQYHSKSKWRDPCYLALATARTYAQEYDEAIKIYRYVANTTKSNPIRAQSQLLLLRLYVQLDRLLEAEGIARVIQRNPITKKKTRLLYGLSMGYLAQKKGNTQALIAQIEPVVELTKDRYLRTRLRFILGEAYEELQQYEKAYFHYRKCAKRNISYNTYLLAQLRTWATAGKSYKKTTRRFKWAVRGRKNKDFIGYIQWEWGKYEDLQQNAQQAQAHYLAAAEKIGDNLWLQGRSFLAAAQSFYREKDYILATAYYDSAQQILPKEDPQYTSTQEKSKLLQRFITSYTTLHHQDSLLELAALPIDSVRNMITRRIVAKKEEEKKKRRKKSLLVADPTATSTGAGNSKRKRGNSNTLVSSTEGGTWYFSNKQYVNKGQKEFQQIWGERPLSDNWRRSQRVKRNLQENPQENSTTQEKTEEILSLNTEENTETQVEDSEEVLIKKEVDEALAQVPFDPKAKQQSLNILEDAYFELGKSYYFDLNELKEAALCFEDLLKRFNPSKYQAHVLYLLALNEALNPTNRKHYGEKLIAQYPDSIHAKLYQNPRYLIEKSQASQKLQAAYTQLYPLYEQQQYSLLQEKLSELLATYEPSNHFYDNVVLLNILASAKVEPTHHYMYRLQRFITTFDTSETLKTVKNWLKGSETVQMNRVYSSKASYNHADKTPYAFMIACSKRTVADSLAQQTLWFLDPKPHGLSPIDWQASSLQTVLLDQGQWLVLGLNLTKEAVIKAYKRYNGLIDDGTLEGLPTQGGFWITEENLIHLFETKDLNAYQQFFSKPSGIKTVQ